MAPVQWVPGLWGNKSKCAALQAQTQLHLHITYTSFITSALVLASVQDPSLVNLNEFAHV